MARRAIIGSLTAWILIATLAAAAVPMLSGIVLIADPTPAYTLDVCHPLASASFNLDQSAAPLIPAQMAAPAPALVDSACEYVSLFSPKPNRAPDPPPPKTRA